MQNAKLFFVKLVGGSSGKKQDKRKSAEDIPHQNQHQQQQNQHHPKPDESHGTGSRQVNAPRRAAQYAFKIFHA